MEKKTLFWIALFAALLFAAAAAFFALKSVRGVGTVAEVWSDGELVRRIDLAAVAVPYDFTVESDWGCNVVHVAHGAISVVEADCPDQICVHQGAIMDGLVPIVCLPHRLVIQIAGD